MDKALIVFLDRDGVICEYYPGGFTTSWDEFRFLPGALESLRLLNEAGARVVVVSNQSGINKGVFSRGDLDEIDRRMKASVARSGGLIEASYYCPHAEEERCRCRKPGTGLIERAVSELGLDTAAASAYMVGDSDVDVIAGHKSGLVTVLVLSGATADRDRASGWVLRPDHVAADLAGALDYII